MTIEKGKDWGAKGDVPVDTPVVDSDAALADLFRVNATADGDTSLGGPGLVALLPNNHVPRTPREATNGLAKTLGARGTSGVVLGAERTLLPVDLGIVTLNPGTEEQSFLVMAASLVAAGTLWSGVTDAVMNAAFLGDWNVAPSGHPNDGRFDVIRAEMGISDRIKARQRLPTGSHLPHPDISIRRLKTVEFRPAASAKVWIDGRAYGTVEHIHIAVVPDAVTLAI